MLYQEQNQKLADILTRGELTKVLDEAQKIFILAEQLFRKTTETERDLKKMTLMQWLRSSCKIPR